MRLTSPLFLLVFLFLAYTSFSQSSRISPYETDLIKDGIIITTGLGLNALGVMLIQNKPALNESDLLRLSREDIWEVDRWAAGNYSEKANSSSYIPMFGSFALPLVLMLSKNERSHAGQISVLFIESMATTGALFTITAGLVEKSRPLVYNTSLSIEDRIAKDEQRSFFAGHTAATASATFFVAKIFHDFNPNSSLRPYIWGIAAAVPATVGYLRIKAGKHFLTDNLVGFAVGAASGILIPEVHKKKNNNLQIYPSMSFSQGGQNLFSQGLGFTYNLN